jgi:hypothetical protein
MIPSRILPHAFCFLQQGIDAVYRELRVLVANLENAAALDRSCENFLNLLFSVLLGSLFLVVVGLDPSTCILSLSSMMVTLAFMSGMTTR